MAVLATYTLDDYQPATGDIGGLRAQLHVVINDAIDAHPRSLQVEIGPSELGTPCPRCLAHKLAGIPEMPSDRWLPQIGTAVHNWLGDTFAQANAGQHPARWLVEQRVSVGEILGRDIQGNADLYDRAYDAVVDWKVVGETHLRTVAGGPKPEYRVQLHAYGRGFARRGLTPKHVAICYLPRNAQSIAAGKWWSEPYDEGVAVAALERCNALATAIEAVGFAQLVAGLPVDPTCYSCARYPNPDGSLPTVTRPGHKPDDFGELL